MTSTLLNAQDISLAIDGKQILQNINLQIDENQIVTLIGPNGAGKTSLVKIVLSLTKPSAGSVSLRKKLRVGYMPQRLHVDNSMPITTLTNSLSFWRRTTARLACPSLDTGA
jgi:zinc transport system ATP-binding protein